MQKLRSNAWYCGSPLQKDFGEKLPKGVLLIDIGSKPKFIELTTPIPLIELNRIPKQWPKAYIKLSCEPKDFPNYLPENVVSLSKIESDLITQKDIKIIHNLTNSKYLLEGMEPFLKKRGLKKEEIKQALKLCKELVDKVENRDIS